MLLRLIAFILLSAQLFSLAHAQDTKPEPSTQTPQATGAEGKTQTEESKTKPTSASKAQWLLRVQNSLPPQLCHKDSDFVKCFDLDDTQCQSMVKWFSEGCLTKMAPDLPQTISMEQGQHYGQILGRCVYDLYNMFLQDKRIKTDDCPAYAVHPDFKPYPNTPSQESSKPLTDPTQPGNTP